MTQTFTSIKTTRGFNGLDTTAVLHPSDRTGTVLGYRIWTCAHTGKTRVFHILTREGGFEAETNIESEAISADMWRSHALGALSL